MFNFFKRKSSQNGQDKKDKGIQMADINGVPLSEGDIVESLRYGLGRCRIIASDKGFDYESLETGEIVSYARMIDAATSFQKVKKIE